MGFLMRKRLGGKKLGKWGVREGERERKKINKEHDLNSRSPQSA